MRRLWRQALDQVVERLVQRRVGNFVRSSRMSANGSRRDLDHVVDQRTDEETQRLAHTVGQRRERTLTAGTVQALECANKAPGEAGVLSSVSSDTSQATSPWP
ncbi:MAG: hypothetical protein U0841_22230 [Chloroflexia bacterium]